MLLMIEPAERGTAPGRRATLAARFVGTRLVSSTGNLIASTSDAIACGAITIVAIVLHGVRTRPLRRAGGLLHDV